MMECDLGRSTGINSSSQARGRFTRDVRAPMRSGHRFERGRTMGAALLKGAREFFAAAAARAAWGEREWAKGLVGVPPAH